MSKQITPQTSIRFLDLISLRSIYWSEEAGKTFRVSNSGSVTMTRTAEAAARFSSANQYTHVDDVPVVSKAEGIPTVEVVQAPELRATAMRKYFRLKSV